MLSTIRGRIIVTFCAFLVFVAALTIFYWWSVGSIRERLLVIEKFEDLLNNILEARRYEKNFFFYPIPDGSFHRAFGCFGSAEV